MHLSLAGCARRAGAVLALLVLAGCGGPRLARAPLPAADLSGHWVLDAAASDDAATLIVTALPKPRVQRKRDVVDYADRAAAPDRGGTDDGRGRGGSGGRRSRSGADRGGDSRQGPVADVVPAWGRLSPKEFVAAFVMPPLRLDIVQESSLVRVGAGDRPRAFEPGDEEAVAVTDRFGSRAVRAGWTGDAFLITSYDGPRLSVVEQLRRSRDDRLERLVEFQARSVSSLKVRSVYRRATDEELETGLLDGPPPPTR